MSNYVVDASIVIQLLIADVHTAETKVLFTGIDAGDRLHIPEFCLLECANVLWKQVRFNNVPATTVTTHLQDLLALDLVIFPASGFLPRAMTIGVQQQLAIYDSVYIAAAEQLAHPLITDDQRQTAAAKAEGIPLKPITDFTR